LGNQFVSVGGGVRYWVKSEDGGPKGFGVRLVFTLLFPKQFYLLLNWKWEL